MPFLLALDEGTTSARAALYDSAGRNLGMEAQPIVCRYPQPGWVEQDAEEIWRAQIETARRLLERLRVPASEIAGVGITNQRETTVVWDRKTGEPVAPAIVWQCRRTAGFCSELARSPEGAAITRKTGLIVDAYFSASKIRWILENVPGARQRDLVFGTIDTWLIWKLTDGALHITDSSNASRTMLMDLDSGDWDDGLLRIFGVPRAMLPGIVPSSGVAAEAASRHLGAAIPIAGIAGDQQAALAGQACFRPGLSKNTYGTGCFALLHTGGRRPVSRNRLLATRAAEGRPLGRGGPQFAIEGSVFIAGAAVQWLRDQLGLICTAEESEAVAASVPDTGGVYFVPAFVGLGAPHWDPDARGIVTGLSRSTSRAHVVRAALESIAYQTRELVECMQADAGEPLQELRVDGGASANNFLMQFQADILGKPIVRPADIETTALGAAYLAGLATGFFKSIEELEAFWRPERRFEPVMPAAVREDLYQGWHTAIARARAKPAVQAEKM